MTDNWACRTGGVEEEDAASTLARCWTVVAGCDAAPGAAAVSPPALPELVAWPCVPALVVWGEEGCGSTWLWLRLSLSWSWRIRRRRALVSRRLSFFESCAVTFRHKSCSMALCIAPCSSFRRLAGGSVAAEEVIMEPVVVATDGCGRPNGSAG